MFCKLGSVLGLDLPYNSLIIVLNIAMISLQFSPLLRISNIVMLIMEHSFYLNISIIHVSVGIIECSSYLDQSPLSKSFLYMGLLSLICRFTPSYLFDK